MGAPQSWRVCRSDQHFPPDIGECGVEALVNGSVPAFVHGARQALSQRPRSCFPCSAVMCHAR